MTEISDKAVEAALAGYMSCGNGHSVRAMFRAALSAALPHLGAAGVAVPSLPQPDTVSMSEGVIRLDYADLDRRTAAYEWLEAYGAMSLLHPLPQEATAEPVAWRGPFTAADAALDELRRAVASTMGYDPETWPTHRNAPLAIAALVALLKGEAGSPPSHDAELLAALREALKPFADEAPYYDPPEGDDGCEAYQRRFLVGDLRAARSAVAKIDAALEAKTIMTENAVPPEDK